MQSSAKEQQRRDTSRNVLPVTSSTLPVVESGQAFCVWHVIASELEYKPGQCFMLLTESWKGSSQCGAELQGRKTRVAMEALLSCGPAFSCNTPVKGNSPSPRPPGSDARETHSQCPLLDRGESLDLALACCCPFFPFRVNGRRASNVIVCL